MTYRGWLSKVQITNNYIIKAFLRLRPISKLNFTHFFGQSVKQLKNFHILSVSYNSTDYEYASGCKNIRYN